MLDDMYRYISSNSNKNLIKILNITDGSEPTTIEIPNSRVFKLFFRNPESIPELSVEDINQYIEIIQKRLKNTTLKMQTLEAVKRKMAPRTKVYGTRSSKPDKESLIQEMKL